MAKFYPTGDFNFRLRELPNLLVYMNKLECPTCWEPADQIRMFSDREDDGNDLFDSIKPVYTPWITKITCQNGHDVIVIYGDSKNIKLDFEDRPLSMNTHAMEDYFVVPDSTKPRCQRCGFEWNAHQRVYQHCPTGHYQSYKPAIGGRFISNENYVKLLQLAGFLESRSWMTLAHQTAITAWGQRIRKLVTGDNDA